MVRHVACHFDNIIDPTFDKIAESDLNYEAANINISFAIGTFIQRWNIFFMQLLLSFLFFLSL